MSIRMIETNVKRVQVKLLDELKEIQRICQKHDITYFMAYGSLLGTIRHEGFIPWDDDMDIMMLREDYNKFLGIALNELKYPYVLQTPGNEEECFYGGYSKIRDSSTTALEMVNWGHACNQGIGIDIFPIDVMSENADQLKTQIEELRYIQGLLYAKAYGKEGFRNFKGLLPEEWISYQKQAELESYKTLCKRMDECLVRYDFEDSRYLSCFTHFTLEKKMYLKEAFKATVKKDFEGIEVDVPVGYEHILQVCYGDYRKVPMEPRRKSKYKIFYNVDVGYEIYNRKFIDIFNSIKDKKVILYGGGEVFKDCLKKCREKERAVIAEERLSDFLKTYNSMQKKECAVILCSDYFEKLESELQEAEIDYYIYTPNRKWLFLR